MKHTATTPKQHRYFSVSFLLAIPGNFLIGSACFITWLLLLDRYLLDKRVWAMFCTGAVAGLGLLGTSEMPRFRTLIHELKHALTVIFTGNLLKAIEVKKYSGRVNYELHAETMHFAPVIVLAPYFLPLLSGPALLACLLLEDLYREPLVFLLGFAVAADLSMAYSELHPRQTDLKQIKGGVFAALSYLASFHFMWLSVCLLWVTAGRKGFIYLAYVVLRLCSGALALCVSSF